MISWLEWEKEESAIVLMLLGGHELKSAIIIFPHFFNFFLVLLNFCTLAGGVLLMSFSRRCIWDERRKANIALLSPNGHQARTRARFPGEWTRMTGLLDPHTFPRYPAQLNTVARIPIGLIGFCNIHLLITNSRKLVSRPRGHPRKAKLHRSVMVNRRGWFWSGNFTETAPLDYPVRHEFYQAETEQLQRFL